MPQTLEQLASRCVRIIARAERDGLLIHNGNVVDLIADNTAASLNDIRAALAIAGHGFSERFKVAINRRIEDEKS